MLRISRTNMGPIGEWWFTVDRYMLFGIINSTVDQYNKEKVVNYKVNLELANLETNEKVWIGDKEIKKYIKN